MTPRKRTPRRTEVARLTQVLLDAGFTKRDVAAVIGRDPSLVSQFFTRGKGASFEPALRAAVQEYQTGNAVTVAQLRGVAAPMIVRRQTKSGRVARPRTKDVVVTPAKSTMARAAKQHIASGASRLRPVVQSAAGGRGRVAFTVRAKRSAFVLDSGYRSDSPGVRRGVVQRRDGTEERLYGNSAGPGLGEAGFDAEEWAGRVDDHDGDVAAAVRAWMEETGRLEPGAEITHLEVRGWIPED
jgi:hypothetical protein